MSQNFVCNKRASNLPKKKKTNEPVGQMTIFYPAKVNVNDDVPGDKVMKHNLFCKKPEN